MPFELLAVEVARYLNLREQTRLFNSCMQLSHSSFQLEEVSFAVARLLTDERLTRLPFITWLPVGEKVTDVGLDRLLTRMDIFNNYFVSDASLPPSLSLTSLDLRNHYLTDATRAPLTHLRSLHLDTRAAITDAAVSRLSSLTELSIGQNNTLITDAALLHLRVLDLSWNGTITNAAVSSLTNLIELSLMVNSTITGVGLAPLTNLAVLDLRDNTTITAADLQPLVSIANLTISAWSSKTTFRPASC